MVKANVKKVPKKKAPAKKRAVMPLENETSYGIMTNTERLRPGGIPRTRKKVAIVGFASSSMREVMPLFEDPDFEIWSINQLYMAFPEIVNHTTRWFQIHARKNYDAAMRDHKHSGWMGLQRTFPIYMQQVEDDIPMSIPIPMGSILKKFGDYFTNSISWEIALAIYEGFEEIHVYGVDMAQDDEYCVNSNTYVLTDGLEWIKASEVKVGQGLMAFDEEPRKGGHRHWQGTKVEHRKDLTLPSYRITMEDGTVLECSAQHQWLCRIEKRDEWVRSDQLESGMQIVKPVEKWEHEQSWTAGYLGGSVDSDGYMSQAHPSGGLVVGFAQQDNAMKRKFEECLEAFGFAWSETPNGSVTNMRITGGKAEALRLLGSIRPPRLLPKFNPDLLGAMSGKAVQVQNIEFIGDQKVVGFKTDAKTFIAEGFATHNTEQRPSVEFFLGWAKGAGIKTYVPDNSDLLKALWLYPLEDDQAFAEKIRTRIVELRQRAGGMAANEQALRDQRMQLLGAADNMRYINRNWRGSIQELRLGKGGGPSARPRVNLLDNTFLDEEKQAEVEAKLRQPQEEA